MSEFHFLRPWWFLALLPVVGLLFALWRHRTAATAWRSVFDPALLERLWLEPPGRVSRLPLLLLGLGWLLAVLALAGPVWERQSEPVWQTRASRILILDLSPSMNAKDLPPSRLDRARFEITDILETSREGRHGLVVFAGEPYTVTPLTDDDETIANLLSALSTEIVPLPGDAGAPALSLGGELLERAGVKQGDLLLLTDGLADPAAALAAAHRLREQGHRLSVLAVGTESGAPVPHAAGGASGMSRLPVETLRELARTGGGAFSRLRADDRDLARVLLEQRRSTPLEETGDAGVERWIERGAWLLLPLLLLAAAGFRRGWLAGLLLVLVLPPPAQAFEWRDLWLRDDQQAADALRRGEPQAAAQQFHDPAWRGTALYRAGEYAQAAEAFTAAKGVDAGYNRGNALARAGHLDEAAQAYRQVLERAPEHADARANLELVQQLLRQQQQPPSSSPDKSADESQDGQQSSDPQSSMPEEGEQGQQQQQGEQQQDEQQQGEQQQGEQGQQTTPSQQREQAQQQQDQAQQQQAQTGEPQDAQPSTPGSEELRQAPTPPGEDSREAARRDVMLPAPGRAGDEDADAPPEAAVPARDMPDQEAEPLNEEALALKQWLRQIPEDPAGLLRRKFMVEHLKRRRNAR